MDLPAVRLLYSGLDLPESECLTEGYCEFGLVLVNYLLDQPIHIDRDSLLTGSPSRFGNFHPPHRLGLVSSGFQLSLILDHSVISWAEKSFPSTTSIPQAPLFSITRLKADCILSLLIISSNSLSCILFFLFLVLPFLQVKIQRSLLPFCFQHSSCKDSSLSRVFQLS